MEIIWYTYCVIGLIILGLWDYIKKIIGHKSYDKDVFLSTCFFFYIIFFALYFIFQWNGYISWEEIMIALPAGIFWLMIPMGMLAALKYWNASFSLVTIRIITSFFLLIIGSFYFWDKLNLMNLVWFVLWIYAIYLLWDYSQKPKRWDNIKGLLWIVIATLWIIWENAYFKYFVNDVDVPSFMFLKFTVTWLLVFAYLTLRKRWWNYSFMMFKNVLPYVLMTTALFLVQFWYFFPKIYSLGPLSISYKILSYSLIVPILLSVLFHWEELTKKRGIAFCLTILSLLFFFF